MRITLLPRLLLFCAAFVLIGVGEAGAADPEAGMWLQGSAKFALGDKWALSVTGMARSADDFERLATFQARAGLEREITDRIAVSAGYASTWHDPQDAPARQEDRLWQQVAWKPGELWGASIGTHVRLEQRFRSPPGGEAAWRLRHEVSFRKPLKAGAKTYVYGAAETFFFLNETAWADDGFARARLSNGIGVPLSKNAAAEFGYLAQIDPQDGAELDVNHYLQVKLRFRR